MTSRDGLTVLAIGLDSCEVEFIDALVASGRLPNLAKLMAEGKRSDIGSTSHIGSGSVWATFATAVHPTIHGVGNEWLWDATTMQVRRFSARGLAPFWQEPAANGLRVGVLDVPFAGLVGLEEGFEVSEWGAHDVLVGSTEVGPAEAAELVAQAPRHPFTLIPDLTVESVARGNLRWAAEGALTGVRLRTELFRRLVATGRPDVGLVVFPELHHLGHVMWDTVEDRSGAGARWHLDAASVSPSLTDLAEAIDDQIGRLLDLVAGNGSVLVFSLHGMRPARGVSGFLATLLRATGFSAPPTWRSRTWEERVTAAFQEIKRLSPEWAKTRYHRSASRGLQTRLARPTMLQQQDWSRTRAFGLPTDQHGLGRINLAGRERDGIVPASEYDALCDELEQELRELVTRSGAGLVERVVRPAYGRPERQRSSLADVIVHWTDAQDEEPLVLRRPAVTLEKIGPHRTGQHTDNAFCVCAGPAAADVLDLIPVEDLSQVILGAAGYRSVGDAWSG